MDPTTFQWLAGIAIVIIGALVSWVVKDFKEKLKEQRETNAKQQDENAKLRAEIQNQERAERGENDRLRDSFDKKVDELHKRINGQEKKASDLEITLTGFQGVFISREEHARECQRMLKLGEPR